MSQLPYNPLDKTRLAASVAQALLANPLVPLSDFRSARGCGVYAIYFSGDFVAYQELASANLQSPGCWPIYIGKAVPKGSRTGTETADSSQEERLQSRLREHYESIKNAENISEHDFWFRSLAVDEIWIPLGETALIRQFRPVWNVLVDGFGNHAPGSGRSNQSRSAWDVLHPGRRWATALPNHPKTAEELILEAKIYLSKNPPPG